MAVAEQMSINSIKKGFDFMNCKYKLYHLYFIIVTMYNMI